jgi:hypothetical protein
MAFWLITALIGLPLTVAIAAGYRYRRAQYPAPVPIAAWDRDNATNAVTSVTRYGPIERRARNRSALASIGSMLLAGSALVLLMAATGDGLAPAGVLVLLGMLALCGALLSLLADEAARTLFVYFGQRAHPSDAFVAPCMWCSCNGTIWLRSRFASPRLVTCEVCAGRGWSSLRALDWHATETWLTFVLMWACIAAAVVASVGITWLITTWVGDMPAPAEGNTLPHIGIGLAINALLFGILFVLWRVASRAITTWGRRFRADSK